MNSPKLLKFACVGAGSIGREFALRHISLCERAEVVAIVDLNLEAAQSLAEDVKYRRLGADVTGSKYRETVDRSSVVFSAEHLPDVAAFAHMSEALDSCDCVYIGTPPLTHASLTLAALAAKKHVLLEKPLAISDEDCIAIVEAAELAYKSDGLVVNVNIGMRFNLALHTMRERMFSPAFGAVSDISLRLHFLQWPRSWQNQPWVALRAQGGPLEEVGTHWIFGLLELLGHGTFREAQCNITYPDGPDGDLGESECQGLLIFERDDGRVSVRVDIRTASEEAIGAGKDIYELRASGADGQSLTLYDFTKLKNEAVDLVPLDGSYGRMECINELVRAVHGDIAGADLVSPRQAWNAQIIVNRMKGFASNF